MEPDVYVLTGTPAGVPRANAGDHALGPSTG